MRTISLVKRLKWNFSGNMNPHALVIGDVDNDNENEFIIGNLNGDLAIFKGECTDGFPSYVCRGLGTITCIAIGDVRNHGKNSVVVINAEGHAHIFDIPSKSKDQQEKHQPQHISVDDYLRGGRRSSDTASIQAFRRMMSGNASAISTPPPVNEQQQQHQYNNSTTAGRSNNNDTPYIHDLGKPNLTLKVPVNVNKILIADIDHDDLNELILARTDRILHAFQLVPSDFHVNNSSFDHMYKGIQTPSISSLSPSASTTSLNALSSHQQQQHQQQQQQYLAQKRPSAATTTTATSATTTAAATTTTNQSKEDNPTSATATTKKMNLLEKNMWVFDGQITSLCTTTHPDRPSEPLLLVAQPGNTFTIIDQDGKRYNRDFTSQQQNTASTTFTTAATTNTLSPPSHLNTRNDTESEDKARIKALLQQDHHRKEEDETAVNVEIFEDESTKVDHDQCNFKRSNYVVKNWPILDTAGGTNNDDVIDDEIESGAVATEIVIGKRHFSGDSFSSSEVGMLSMDGKFSIYDLRTKTTSQRDLFVTHKLFSLATLDVSSSTTAASLSNKSSMEKSSPSLSNSSSLPHRYHHHTAAASGAQTPMSGTSNLRYSTTTPRHETSLNEGSRNSSKLSLNGLANSFNNIVDKKQSLLSYDNSADEEDNDAEEEEDVINKRINDTITTASDDDSLSSGDDEDDSDYESVPWSEEGENEDEPGCDLFVACAWNGVTYLIDWSKKIDEDETQAGEDNNSSKIKYQLVKFAFEGRVCAFTAGLYSVENQINVPCLFYVDFEDQIYVYYDVRISPGPVTGFIDTIDDDVEEALDRIIGIESGIDALTESNQMPKKKKKQQQQQENESSTAAAIDLGDGWQGIADDDEDDEDDDIVPPPLDQQHPQEMKLEDSDPINLADFIHECLYGFEDMKDRMENEVLVFEQNRLSSRLPPGGDTRRLSDLNITIDPPALDNDVTSDSASLGIRAGDDGEEEEDEDDDLEIARASLYPIDSNISEESSESYDNDTHIASWIEGSLIGSSIYNNKEVEEQEEEGNNAEVEDDSSDIS